MRARAWALSAMIVGVAGAGCIEKNPDYCADADAYNYSCSKAKAAAAGGDGKDAATSDASDGVFEAFSRGQRPAMGPPTPTPPTPAMRETAPNPCARWTTIAPPMGASARAT
jgi:hypothetical protein